MHRKARGFTLLELVTTLAVLAITLGVGIPAFGALMERARVSSALHLTTAALATARVEAVRRNRPVSVCPSADGRTCRTDLAWEAGWLVFIDAKRSGQPGSDDDVLQAFDGIGPNLMFRATVGRRLVRFSPRGWSAGSNVTLRLCNDANIELARLVVNNAGRVRTERQAASRVCGS